MGPSKEKIEALEARMADLGIRKQDIEEKFIKSSGRGGQKVNKTSSAVFLRHVQTGLFVKCGKERSLHLNRFLALRRLVDKIESEMTGRKDKDTERIEKIKKQKRRRQRKAMARQTIRE